MADRRGRFRPRTGRSRRIALRTGQRRHGRPRQFRGALLGPFASGQLHRRGLLPRQDARGVVEERLPGVFRQGAQRGLLDRGGCRGRRRIARSGDGRGEGLLPRTGHAPLGADAPHDGHDAQRRRNLGRGCPLPAASAPRTGCHPICRHAAEPCRRDHLFAPYRRRCAQCRRQLRREILGAGRNRCRRHAEPHPQERFRSRMGAGRGARRRRIPLRNTAREGPPYRHGVLRQGPDRYII